MAVSTGLPALFDTHCHLDAAAFAADREVVLARSRALGVEQLLVPAVRAAGWQPLLAFCRKRAGVHCALGLHPVYAQQHQHSDLAKLEAALATERPVAIGEIGLDYAIDDQDRAWQQALFAAQLAIARMADLPVILHVRKAHDQVLALLKRCPVPGGIVHAYNGSLVQAKQYMALGFVFGFGGMLTYERSTKLRRLAQDLPLSSLVLETDAPDLTVVQHRGERNSPEYLPWCLQALAQARGAELADVARHTTANALAVLRLPA